MTVSLAGPLLLVGAGKMGGALLEGWLRQGLDPASVFIQDPAPPPEVADLAARHGIAASAAPDLPGDLDGDWDVDLSDFTEFQLCFGGSNNPPAPTCPPGVDADCDSDGDVDLADFLIFQQNFTGSL